MLKTIRRSLRLQVIIAVCGLLTAIFVVLTIEQIAAEKERLIVQAFHETDQIGRAILAGIRYQMLIGDQETIQKQFDEFVNFPELIGIALIDHNGIIRRSVARGLLNAVDRAPYIKKALSGEAFRGIEQDSPMGPRKLTQVIPVYNDTRCYKCHGLNPKVIGALKISLNAASMEKKIHADMNRHIVVSLIALLIAGILVNLFFLRAVVIPLRQLVRAVQKVSEGDLDTPVVSQKKDEIGILARIFDATVVKLRLLVETSQTLVQKEQEKSEELVQLNENLMLEIADRKKVEALRQETEERYKHLVDNISVGVALISPDRRVITANQQMRRFWPDNQETGLPFYHFQVAPPRSSATCPCPTCRSLEDGQVHELVTETQHDDVTINFRIVSSALRGGGGAIVAVIEMVEEITIRKQAEEKIKQQNKFLNTVIESLAQPFFVIEVADYRVTVANTAAHYGYFPEDATCHALTHNRSTPCEGEFHPCPRDAVIKSGKPVVFEHRHTDETGAVRYFEVHGYPIFGEAGAVTQMIEYTVDITDRKRVEAEILRAKEQAELLYKIIPSGIFTVDCDDVVTTWNDKSAEITGYPVQEVLGKKCPIFNDLPGEERVGRFDPELPIAQTAIECVIRRKDGTKRVVLKNTEYLYDSQGKVAGGIESFEDITERKQAEEKIKIAADEWSRTFDAINDMIFIQDKEEKIVKLNRALAEALEIEPEKLIGKTIPEIARENNAAWLEHAFYQKKKEGNPASEEVYDSQHGIPLLVTVSPVIGGNGDYLGSVYVAKDITELKKAEEALKEHARKLSEMYRVKSDFTSMVSHELRTPLTAIKEGIAIVLDGSAGEINADQKEFLDMAKKNVDRLKRLIDDVLNFSKLESKKLEFRMKDADLNAVIREVSASQTTVAREKGLFLETKLDEQVPSMRFDTDRVIQVLNNLISNALKFTEQGGITVTSLLDKDSSSVTVRVRDTGEGIRSEDLPKLFQKFEQLGGLNQRKTGGTGLGLAISKEIILQHGGSIFAESEYGKGTVVTFILPLQQRQTILIIDDERMLLDICEMNLKAGGYNVLLSESGVDGLELAQKKSPDLVILDMKLADLSGYELIGRLRSNKATAAIPILVMSGYAEEIAKIEYNQQELALPWISKPFRNEDFLALIKSLLIK